MKTMLKRNVLLALGVLVMGTSLRAQESVIYNNSTNDLHTRFNPGTLEVGNQVVLAGTERFLTTFTFEDRGTNTASATTFAGDVQARVRFYENNGSLFNGYPTPGTNFFDSGWFTVPTPTDRSTFLFTAGSDFSIYGLPIPADEITWTVQFQGMGLTDSVGVDLYSPPVAGQGQLYNDYWQYAGGSWSVLTNSLSPMGFGAFMAATIPEPSVFAISIIGGLCLLTLTRRLRRND